MAMSCWHPPVANRSTYVDVAKAYFSNVHNDTASRRAALITVLGDAYTQFAELLKMDEDLPKRMNMFEQMLRIQYNRSLEVEAALRSHPYYDDSCVATRYLWTYLPPILLILGTIGNVLSFIVMCQKGMVHTSTYVYLAALAIVDEAVLLSGLLRIWIDRITGVVFEDGSDAACQFAQVVGITFNGISVWLIVVVTLERLLVILFPLHASNLTSPQRSRIVILVVTFLFFTISTHFITSAKVVKLNVAHITEKRCEIVSATGKLVWGILDGILFSYLPILFISFMNGIILIELRKVGRHRATLLANTRHSSISNDHKTCHNHKDGINKNGQTSSMVQLTVMLLVVSGTFIVTTLPTAVMKTLQIVMTVTDYTLENDMLGPYQLADAIAELLMFLNYSVNFLLYCATGAKFRNQLRRLCLSDRSGYSGRSIIGVGAAHPSSTVNTTAVQNHIKRSQSNDARNNTELSEALIANHTKRTTPTDKEIVTKESQM